MKRTASSKTKMVERAYFSFFFCSFSFFFVNGIHLFPYPSHFDRILGDEEKKSDNHAG